jgi:DnaJ homolog subfamily B member 6
MHGPGSSHRNRHAGPFERERSFFPNPFHGGHHSGHYHRNHRNRHQPHPSFAFTDPFAFFNSFIEQLSRNDPFFAEFSPQPRSQPFVPAPAPAPFPFGGLFSQGGPSGFPAGFGPFSQPSIGPGRSWGSGGFSSSSFSSHSAPRGDPPGEYWTQESRTTRTINGVTESIWKRTDSNVSS